jgi:hypothetical protein
MVHDIGLRSSEAGRGDKSGGGEERGFRLDSFLDSLS